MIKMGILQVGENCPAGLPEQRIGNWRIKHAKKEAGVYNLHGQVAGYDHYELKHDGKITLLQELRDKRWHDWMTDDYLYYAAMRKIGDEATGNVLVGGLGLGIVLQHLTNERIIVVERQQEVIGMVWPHVVDQTMELSHGDFFSIDEPDAFLMKIDTVITDFWVGSPREQQVQDLFLRTFEHVNNLWPDAQQFYHGIQPWSRLLKPLWDCGLYETLRPEQRRGLLQSVLPGTYS